MTIFFKQFFSALSLCVLFLTPLTSRSEMTNITDEENIREAVFRYQFSHNGTSLQNNAKAYYLSYGMGNEDPPDKFLKRFAKHQPKVFKISKLNSNSKETKGVIFRITYLRWINKTEVEVGGGIYEGPLSGSGGIYSIKKHNGKWIVEKYQPTMIS